MQNERLEYLRGWLLCSKDFSEFGGYLIRKFPFQYARYYLIPNAWNVMLPPADKGVIHSIEEVTSDDLISAWFGIPKGVKFSTGRSEVFTSTSKYLSFGNLLIWVVFLASLIFWFVKRKAIGWTDHQQKTVVVLAAFVVMYAGFSALAGPFEFRYVIPMRPLLIALPLIVLTATVFPKPIAKT